MYDTLKKFNDKVYSGMQIGNSHKWHYNNGKWFETKLTPDMWQFSFQSIKTRFYNAPFNSGAKVKTKYHWYIIADQIASKLDNNSYITYMKGFKYKLGHKRPNWRNFSYDYPEQESYKQRVIKILEDTLIKLKNDKINLEKYI